jgi:hypothetical protein
LEHRAAIEMGADVQVATAEDGVGSQGIWVSEVGGEVLASAMVGFGPR